MRILLSLGMLLLLLPPAFAQSTPLRAAAIFPLTGKGASVGVSMRNGMTMAYEGLPADVKGKLELRFEDSAGESKQGVSIAQRFIAAGDTDVILSAFSNVGNAIVPITEHAGTPLLSLAYDHGISNGKSSAFTFWYDVKDVAAASVAEALKRGYRTIGVVATIHEGNIAMRNAL